LSGVVVDSTGCAADPVPGDIDRDGDVDQSDFGLMQACLSGFGVTQNDPDCAGADLDDNTSVDHDDVVIFKGCMSGFGILGDPDCKP